MRAAVMRSFGPPSVLRVESDVPLPPPFGPPQQAPAPTSSAAEANANAFRAKRPPANVPLALVKVAYASVNPIDWKTRKGEFPRFLCANPKILGGDLSGVVVALCPLASAPSSTPPPFRVGDRVFSLTGLQEFWQPYGCAAEYAAVPLDRLAHAPEGLPLREAAAVPLAAMTAWQALSPAFPLAGKRVLVHAAAGGVGAFAVQIARQKGAAVVHGTCGPRNADFLVRELGADAAIDYTAGVFEDHPLAREEGGYDVVVDLVGGDYERRSLALLRRRAEWRREAWVREAERGGQSLPPFAPRPYLAEVRRDRSVGRSVFGPSFCRPRAGSRYQSPSSIDYPTFKKKQKKQVLNSGALREAGGNALRGALGLLGSAAAGYGRAFFDRGSSPLYRLIVVRPEARAGGLEDVGAMLAARRVRVFVEREFSLEDAAEAHALVEAGHVRGKVVLRVGGGE